MKTGSVKSLRKRLEKLERQLRVEAVDLLLDNGEVLHIRRRDVLKIATAGMRRRYAEIEGQPQPESSFDQQLDLLSRIASPPANQPLLALACALLDRGPHE